MCGMKMKDHPIMNHNGVGQYWFVNPFVGVMVSAFNIM